MDAVKGRTFEYVSVPIRVHDNGGGFDADDIGGGGGGGDETISSAEEMSAPMVTPVSSQSPLRMSASRTSELTISFEGEVYVFPAVTPEKVQAVLLLLGGRETPTSIPSSEFLLQLNDKAVDDVSSQPTVSRRIASLERFREKRKERCFEKKIRYTCRKEVAQRMHRKNGQFASVKDICKASDDNWDSGSGTPHPESVLRRCQHCGVSESSTPAMRRGPAGPRTLCNACGLMWANKGTLRDLTKGGRHIFDQNEPEPLEIKPPATGPDSSYCTQNDERTPEQTQLALVEFGNPSARTEQDMMEITEGIADDSSIGIENSSGNLGEQDFEEYFSHPWNSLVLKSINFYIIASFGSRKLWMNLQIHLELSSRFQLTLTNRFALLGTRSTFRSTVNLLIQSRPASSPSSRVIMYR